MNIFTKQQKAMSSELQDLGNKLGQAIYDIRQDGYYVAQFYHVTILNESSFKLDIAMVMKSGNTPLSNESVPMMYKSSISHGLSFTFTKINTLKINGKDVSWVITSYSYETDIIKAFKDILGDVAYTACYYNPQGIVDPMANPNDFFVNCGNALNSIENQVNIPVFLMMYNDKFNTSYVTLNDLFYGFWREHWSKSLDDIANVIVNGFNIGNHIVDNTYGKFLVLL